ncbi:hypothetical protein [Dyella silvatica]|uniref:hypothetical protein n=1 Tax=Dyella silvatica TaxID=2992128 RepID=UPI0022510E5C|nr:hypothetical protein [Dyella silvatica]
MSDEEKLTVKIERLGFDGELMVDRPVTILPANMKASPSKYEYSSTSMSFYKYARGHLALDYLTKPERLYTQQSVDVFLPAFLFGVGQVVENPDLVKMLLEVIVNFAKETFVGDKAPTVKATFLSREIEEEKYVSVTYEGPLEGLASVAPAFLKAIKHED